jgi:hypothetical protein
MKRLLYFFVPVLLFSCNKSEVQYPENPAITGLATPIRLNPGKTEIIMEDYFTETSNIDSVTLPEQLLGTLSPDKKILQLEPSVADLPYLMVIDVWSAGFPYSILVKKSTKINFTLQFDPQNKTYKNVNVAGEINGWNPKAGPMELVNGKWRINLELFPGKYQYQLVLDDKWQLDPNKIIRRQSRCH